MIKTLDDIKIVSTDEEITELVEEANFYLLSAERLIEALPKGKRKDDWIDCLTEIAMPFVCEVNHNIPNDC